MNVTIGAKTDPGRRTNNEDRFAVVDTRRHRLSADGLLIIADGMGGRQRGEHAAETAVETVQDTLLEMLASKHGTQADTGEAMISALRKANARVFELSRKDPEGQGMGTTCVAAVIQDTQLTLAHAGDSRAYLLRGSTLTQLTDDHSYVAEQVRAGAITEEGAKRSRFRNVITRAVGIEPTLAPEVSRHDVQPGDKLLLCTDGLSNIVSTEDIAQTLEYAPSPQAAADRLVQQATRAGGKDNITAIVAGLTLSSNTMQMRAEDLPRFKNSAAAADQENTAEEGEDFEEDAETSPARSRGWAGGGQGWLIAAVVVIALLAFACTDMAHVLARDGYRFGAAPPFVSRPASVKAPAASKKPSNLAALSYQPPIVFFFKPVQGGLLSLNPSDGALTVVTLNGRVVRLTSNGAMLSESAALDPKTMKGRFVFPADSALHVATDPQGDFYISDQATHQVLKYGPDLIKPLGRIPGLSDPGALAVAPDGTIYVIDAERLKIIRPLP